MFSRTTRPLRPTRTSSSLGPESKGFQVVTYPNRISVGVTGTVAQVKQAFYANVVIGTRPDGSQFYRLDRQPSLDLGVTLQSVSGLDNYAQRKTSSSGGSAKSALFQSSDLRAAYLGGANPYCASLNGAGQLIGIFDYGGFDPNDIATYQSLTGLTGVPPVKVLKANDPNGLPPEKAPPIVGADGETTMDIESAMAMAPGAQIVVFQADNQDSAWSVATNHPEVGQFSASQWNGPVTDHMYSLYALMAAQSQSYSVPSGDGGAQPPVVAPTCPDQPNQWNPHDFDYMTVVGGTALNLVGGQYSSETTWSGSGGGVRLNVSLPSYQVNVNPANTQLSTTNRNFPDVAMVGDPSFYEYCGGTDYGCGGTSLSSPLWAGFMALLNQAASQNLWNGFSAWQGRFGFVNPALYQIGQDPVRYAQSFHDINDNSTNTNSCGFGYNAVAGYDLTTGFGTPSCGLITTLTDIPPVATIVTPADGATVTQNVPVAMEGYATSALAPTGVPCSSLQWTDTFHPTAPPITGCSALITFETTGTGYVTLRATDMEGIAVTTKIAITVAPAGTQSPPSPQIVQPAPESVYEGTVVQLVGTAVDPNGDTNLTYQWSFVYPDGNETPIGSGASLTWTAEVPHHCDPVFGSLKLVVTNSAGVSGSTLIPFGVIYGTC